jgi:flagellar rod assembly protein/muramidase FlgJ
MSPDEFIAAIAPAAVASMRTFGVPASLTIAQAALESAWGSRAPGNNLFGIKADPSWTGPVVSVPTHEDLGGRWVAITANFRAYATWQGCMDDHAAFLRRNPRYAACFQTRDGQEFARRVAAAGYATDPAYADKLIATMRSHDLQRFDQVVA